MGRVPRSPPCSAMPLYPCLITHWTVKYTSWPIINDKQLIKATRKNLIKKTRRCGEGVHSCEIIFCPRRWPWYPEDDHPYTLLHLLCVCVCVNKSYHVPPCVSIYVREHVWDCERLRVGVCGCDMCVGVHSPQAINKMCSYKETCGEVVK